MVSPLGNESIRRTQFFLKQIKFILSFKWNFFTIQMSRQAKTTRRAWTKVDNSNWNFISSLLRRSNKLDFDQNHVASKYR